MFFYLSKILDFLIQPLVWVLILMLISLVFKKRRKSFLIAAMLTLYFFSNHFIFFEVSRAYEAKAKKEHQLKENYDAAIVLGGMVSMDEANNLVAFEGSSDRFLAILPLYFNKKIDKIIISGGSGRLLQDEKEAEILKTYLLKIGVKEKDILIETSSKNTYENALQTAELIKKNNLNGPFLLSTSASHMYRSQLCFKKQGIEVDIYPVDHFALERELNPDRLFVPKAEILKRWKSLIHEWLGLISYKLNGYI